MHKIKCYFCMEQEPTSLITDTDEDGTLLDYWLCEKCKEDKEVADKRRKAGLSSYLDQDPSKLCLQCGICCFMLNAKITQEELDKMEEVHGIAPERFAEPPDYILDAKEGDWAIKMPCKYLLGRPLQWSGCRIHEKYRPSVCESYLCKMAMKYKMGIVSLGEARYWLRYACLKNDFSVFNWVKGKDESKVLISSGISARVEQLRQAGATDEEIKLCLADMITPEYAVDGALSQFTLNMYFAVTDRGDYDPTLFLSEDELQEVDKLRGWDATVFTIEKVMKKLRELFIQKSSGFVEEVMSVDTDQASVIQADLSSSSSNHSHERAV